MKTLNFYTLCCLFLCISCTKDALKIDTNLTYKPLDKNINLSHVKWGQVSKYLAYQADCPDMDASFKYTGDTLIVQIKEEWEELVVEEFLTPYSTSYLNGEVTDTFRYPIELQDDRIVLRERSNSRLFFFYDSDFLPLNFPPLMPTALQDGCRLNLGETPFTGNELVQFPEFKVGDIHMYNKAAVSCRPIVEGDGYLIYDKDRLYLSHTITDVTFSGTYTFITGWRLLED